MNFTIPIYQDRVGARLRWTTVGLGRTHTRSRTGGSNLKIQRALVDELKGIVRRAPAHALREMQLRRGLTLTRLRLELVLRGADKKKKVSGLFPLLIWPRHRTRADRFSIAFHPLRQEEWFAVDPERPLEEQALAFFQHTLRDLSVEAIEELRSSGKDSIRALSFSERPATLLDQLPSRKGVWDDLDLDRRADPTGHRGGAARVLPRVGVNLTPRAADDLLSVGVPRPAIDDRLLRLLSGTKRRPVMLVGGSGAGKTTALHRLVHALLAVEDYPSHRNLDRCTEVWRISGKRIIAGMSHLGEWEERCVQLLADLRGRKAILWIEDVHNFGRIGRSKDSERNLADFFRGPLARGEVVFVAECTPEQERRLEEDAPAFADLFARVRLPEAGRGPTTRMLFHQARILELERHVRFEPTAFRLILELGGTLLPNRVLPGRALDLLKELAKRHASEGSLAGGEEGALDRAGEGARERPGRKAEEGEGAGATKRGEADRIGTEEVIELLAARTGLPPALLMPREPLPASRVRARLTEQVMGQPEAVEAAIDLILRVRGGLTDPRRPFGVYLLTGPTGTGKTELARALASFLYGGEERLLRFDMGELGAPDAPAKLIGDAFEPEGRLTAAVREQPFCVVLFDEIEKAHPAVLNLLLQLFDEGRLTDADGQTASFTRAVIVMTSNLGARAQPPLGFGEAAAAAEAAVYDTLKAVRELFPPELFNRIDRIVPFRPLSPEAAARVAHKELSRLLSRRGLTDRQVFVIPNERASRRIVKEAFDPRDGARSVKRYLEDRVGGLLVEELAKAPSSEMRIARLYDSEEGFALRIQRLEERDPVEAEHALAGSLRAGSRELRRALPAVITRLDRLESEGLFASIEERLHQRFLAHREGDAAQAAALHHLELLRGAFATLRADVEALLGDPEERYAELERRLEEEEVVPAHDGYRERRQRLERSTYRPFFNRTRLLRALAEAHFLERVAQRVEEVERHTVLIELARVGPSGAGSESKRSLLDWLTRGYLGARGELLEGAVACRDGERRPFADTAELKALVRAFGVERVVLKIGGLGVLDFFGEEHGCHLWSSLIRGAEVVRVGVRAAEPGERAIGRLEEQERELALYEAALERGDRELPVDPFSLLPVVRRLRFELPIRPGERGLFEIEDYTLGAAEIVEAKQLPELLRHLLLIRASRVL